MLTFPFSGSTLPMVIAFRPTHPLTSEELETLSRENPGICFERDAGGKLIVSPTGTLGGRGELGLGVQVNAWAQRNGSGFARWNALSHKERAGYARISPDVAFELLPPHDLLRDARAKAAAYLANGTRLVVLLDPRPKLVELHRPNQAPISHDVLEAVPLEPEMPGFTLDAAAVFKLVENG